MTDDREVVPPTGDADTVSIDKLLSQILSSNPEIRVVGTAADPHVARDKIKQLNPDVLTSRCGDAAHGRATFLRNRMRLRPMPGAHGVFSDREGTGVTLQALEYGAVDFVTKPGVDIANRLGDYGEEIIGKLKMVACARVRAIGAGSGAHEKDPVQGRDMVSRSKTPRSGGIRTTEMVVALGASTGPRGL